MQIAKKVLAVFLAALFVLPGLGVGMTASAADTLAELPASGNVESGKYIVSADRTISATADANGLTVTGGKVEINLPAGVTLTVNGGDETDTAPGKGGILLASGAELVFTGSGNLIVTGGKGSNGGNGTDGADGYAAL